MIASREIEVGLAELVPPEERDDVRRIAMAGGGGHGGEDDAEDGHDADAEERHGDQLLDEREPALAPRSGPTAVVLR